MPKPEDKKPGLKWYTEGDKVPPCKLKDFVSNQNKLRAVEGEVLNPNALKKGRGQ